ncbi:MAG: hypothetical protein M0Z94_04505 [Dehalococcoidales bacterium]|nr:hypothetical protein [Dehalococcoidales bacterium]
MDAPRIWLLTAFALVVLIVLVWQRYSLWNAMLTFGGSLLFVFVLVYTGYTGQPIADVDVSHALAAVAGSMLTTGVLNQKYGRAHFPDGV